MKLLSKINIPLVIRIEGLLLLVEGLFMLSVLPVTFFYTGVYAFSMPVSALITMMMGLVFVVATRRHKKDKTTERDGVVIVCISWLVLSLFGSLPYLFSKSVPNFTDAFFEALSGFTTTGATILPDIENVSKDILFWRSMTQWMGGLAIIAFPIAILPVLSIGGMQLFMTEMNSITNDKLHPRIMHTVKRVWLLYVFFTLLETLLLYFGDMDFYDALCHAMSTISSGGFSTHNANMSDFSSYSQIVVCVFMVLAGCNFTLLLLSITRPRYKAIIHDEEFSAYLKNIFFVGLGFALVLWLVSHLNVATAFRQAFFSVVSCITTTGFFVADYAQWPLFLSVFMLLLIFVGGCSGSSSGGVRVIRHLIFIRNSFIELKRIIHPNAIVPVKINDKSLSSSGIFKNITFIVISFFVIVASLVILLSMGIDFETSIGASLATLSNAGVSMGAVGPFGSYVFMPQIAKWILMLLMLLGRLELFTLIILFSRHFWKN